MAYEFKPYRSVYRDPQSVAVSEVLRDRYISNFATDSMLDKSLNEMLVAAEFAGDVEKANELKARLAETAKARTDRGDFENMGMAINMDVRDFSKNYTPLKQNYDAREKDKEEKREMVTRGLISQQQYDSWERRSLLNTNEEGDYESYTGVTVNADGTVDQGTTYQPKAVALNVNVDKEVLNALQSIEADRGGGTVIELPQLMDIDGDGVMEQYAVRTTTGQYEKISEADVRAVTNEVLSRDDVRSYLDQEADFDTMELREDELDTKITSRISTINARLASGRESSENADILRAEKRALENAMTSGTVGQKRQLARAASRLGRVEGITQMAIDAKAINNVIGGGREVRFVRQLANPDAGGRGGVIDRPPSVPGPTEETVSSLAGDDGNVTVESATEAVTAAQEAADSETARLITEYPAIFETLATQPGMTSIGDNFEFMINQLDTMSLTEIKTMLEGAAAEGKLVNANGSTVTVAAAYEQFVQAKQTVEHFNSVNEARNNLFEVARQDASTGNQTDGISPEVVRAQDWANNNEWQQYVTGNEFTLQVTNPDGGVDLIPLLSGEERTLLVGGPQRGITNHEALIGGMLQELFPPNTFGGGFGTEPVIDHPLYGNVIDHMHSALGGMIDKERIREIYNDYAENGTDSNASVAAGYFGEVNRFGNEFIERLEAGHQRVMDIVNEDSRGRVTYPQSERPAYVPETVFDTYVKAVQGLDISEVLTRTTVTGDSIEEALDDAGLSNAESVSNIFVSWYTKDGVPTPALVLEVKGKDGQRNITRNVKVDPYSFIANAPGIVEGFGLNTLDNKIISTALAIYNEAPGLARRTNKVTVPYNDGADTSLSIEFTAAEVRRAGEDGPPSINLNAGTVRISGTVNGIEYDKVMSYTEAMETLHDIGFKQGLQGDIDAERMMRGDTTPAVGD